MLPVLVVGFVKRLSERTVDFPFCAVGLNLLSVASLFEVDLWAERVWLHFVSNLKMLPNGTVPNGSILKIVPNGTVPFGSFFVTLRRDE